MRGRRTFRGILTAWMIAAACLHASPSMARGADATLLDAPRTDLLTYGQVCCLAYLPDGSLIVGGGFQWLNGQPRRHLAKLLPNGEVDAEWKPEPNNVVTSLAVDPSGNVYVGGAFYLIGGKSRNYLAKIAAGPEAHVDPHWPDNFGSMYAASRIVVSSDGSTIIASRRNPGGIRMYSATGALNSVWQPDVTGGIDDVAFGPAGMLYVGGDLRRPGVGNGLFLLRVSVEGTGEVDASWNPQPSGRVLKLALDANGDSLIVGGEFMSVSAQERPYLARIGLTSGALDPQWTPAIDWSVDTFLFADGHLHVSTNPRIPGLWLREVVRVDVASGEVDEPSRFDVSGNVAAIAGGGDTPLALAGTFARVGEIPSFNLFTMRAGNPAETKSFEVGDLGSVYDMAVMDDGSIIVGGMFEWAGGVPRSNLFRLKSDRTIDLEWDPSPDRSVSLVERGGAGAVVVAGSFQRIGGSNAHRLAKISSSGRGAADPQWNPALIRPGSSVARVSALRYDGQGNLYAAGIFDAPADVAHRNLAKIPMVGPESGSVVPDWRPAIDGAASALAVDSAQRLYAAVGTRVSRFAANSEIDTAWVVETEGDFVAAIAIDSLQRLYIGGAFSRVGTKIRSGLARVGTGPAAVVDPQWTPAAQGVVWNIAAEANDQVYVGGRIESISGTPVGLVARLQGHLGTLDTTWNPAIREPWWSVVRIIHVDSANRVLVGGSFEEAGSAQRFGFAAFGDSIFVDGVDPSRGN